MKREKKRKMEFLSNENKNESETLHLYKTGNEKKFQKAEK